MLKKLILVILIVILNIAEVYATVVVNNVKVPFKHDTSNFGGQIQKITVAFLLVVLIAYFVIFWLKKYSSRKFVSKKGGENVIKITDRKYLAKNLTIVLLQINNTKYSLAQTQNELIILEKEIIKIDEKNNNSETTIN